MSSSPLFLSICSPLKELTFRQKQNKPSRVRELVSGFVYLEILGDTSKPPGKGEGLLNVLNDPILIHENDITPVFKICNPHKKRVGRDDLRTSPLPLGRSKCAAGLSHPTLAIT
jgi:hypothetical protein